MKSISRTVEAKGAATISTGVVPLLNEVVALPLYPADVLSDQQTTMGNADVVVAAFKTILSFRKVESSRIILSVSRRKA